MVACYFVGCFQVNKQVFEVEADVPKTISLDEYFTTEDFETVKKVVVVPKGGYNNVVFKKVEFTGCTKEISTTSAPIGSTYFF